MTHFTASPQLLAAGRDIAGHTVLISGGSRGIGHAIATTLASAGANIVLVAKTDTPHPSLEGTVHSAVADIDAAGEAGRGGRGSAVVGDVRSDEDVQRAVQHAVTTFGGIDHVINNASAINLSSTERIDPKRYDLMQDINARGTFMLSKAAFPELRRSAGAGRDPHILTLSPPLNLDPRWFGEHLAYTMAKYAMSMTTLGFAEELRSDGVQVNSLWPATLIDTAALRAIPGGARMVQGGRSPQIVADAALALILRAAPAPSGGFLTDEEVLAGAGMTELAGYAVDPEAELIPDIFL